MTPHAGPPKAARDAELMAMNTERVVNSSSCFCQQYFCKPAPRGRQEKGVEIMNRSLVSQAAVMALVLVCLVAGTEAPPPPPATKPPPAPSPATLCAIPVDIAAPKNTKWEKEGLEVYSKLWQEAGYPFQWLKTELKGTSKVSPSDMLALGKANGCDYVAAASVTVTYNWKHMRDNNTTVEGRIAITTSIVDVAKQEVVLNVEDKPGMQIFVPAFYLPIRKAQRLEESDDSAVLSFLLKDKYEPFLSARTPGIKISPGEGQSAGGKPAVTEPSVAFTTPKPGTEPVELSGSVKIGVIIVGSATEAKLTLDGKEVRSADKAPTSWEINTADYANGEHTLDCRVTFEDGSTKSVDMKVKFKSHSILP